MSDRFDRFTVPAPDFALRARVLAAVDDRRPSVALRSLDLLGASRAWWLAWSAAMVLLIVVAGGQPISPSDRAAAEQWRDHRAQAQGALGATEVALARETTASSGGGA